MLLEKIDELIHNIQIVEKIFSSEANWEIKYNLIFKFAKENIYNLIDELGLSLDYSDPDTSYEEDVTAFCNALFDLKKELIKIENPNE